MESYAQTQENKAVLYDCQPQNNVISSDFQQQQLNISLPVLPTYR